jgi:hypothetical protein
LRGNDENPYQDSDLQLQHARIYDQALVQALGRARGLNRTARNPVEIWACANVPLPLPVASITRWRPASRLAKMLLAGFVPLNAADMARFYPDLFHERGSARGSVAAAAQAIHRWGGKAAMLAEIERLARRSPAAFDSVTFQPKGQGFKAREGICRRRQLHEARDRVRREFADWVEGWSVSPFTPGTAPLPLWPADEHDIPGKKDFFREMSLSSSAFQQGSAATGGAAPADGPRAPPDG